MKTSFQTGLGKVSLLIVLAILAGLGFFFLSGGDEVRRSAELKALEVVGNVASRRMPDDVAGGFHQIPIERKELAPGIYQATGVANTHMITTSEGDVLFDSGLALQVPQQIKLLEEVARGPLTHIIVSHSHADHIGGVKFWHEEGVEIVAHKEFLEEQRYQPCDV